MLEDGMTDGSRSGYEHDREQGHGGGVPNHPLFPLPEGAPDRERPIVSIHIARRVKGGGEENAPEQYPAHEITSWRQIYDLFGGGRYRLSALDANGRYVTHFPGPPKTYHLLNGKKRPMLPPLPKNNDDEDDDEDEIDPDDDDEDEDDRGSSAKSKVEAENERLRREIEELRQRKAESEKTEKTEKAATVAAARVPAAPPAPPVDPNIAALTTLVQGIVARQDAAERAASERAAAEERARIEREKDERIRRLEERLLERDRDPKPDPSMTVMLKMIEVLKPAPPPPPPPDTTKDLLIQILRDNNKDKGPSFMDGIALMKDTLRPATSGDPLDAAFANYERMAKIAGMAGGGSGGGSGDPLSDGIVKVGMKFVEKAIDEKPSSDNSRQRTVMIPGIGEVVNPQKPVMEAIARSVTIGGGLALPGATAAPASPAPLPAPAWAAPPPAVPQTAAEIAARIDGDPELRAAVLEQVTRQKVASVATAPPPVAPESAAAKKPEIKPEPKPEMKPEPKPEQLEIPTPPPTTGTTGTTTAPAVPAAAEPTDEPAEEVAAPTEQDAAAIRVEQAKTIAAKAVDDESFSTELWNEVERLKAGGTPKERPATQAPDTYTATDIALVLHHRPELFAEVMKQFKLRMDQRKADAQQAQAKKQAQQQAQQAKAPSKPAAPKPGDNPFANLSMAEMRKYAREQPEVAIAFLTPKIGGNADFARNIVHMCGDPDVSDDVLSEQFGGVMQAVMSGEIDFNPDLSGASETERKLVSKLPALLAEASKPIEATPEIMRKMQREADLRRREAAGEIIDYEAEAAAAAADETGA